MRENRQYGAQRQSLLGFATMRRLPLTPAISAVALLASACAVYDSGLVQSNDGLTGGGTSGSSGGSGGSVATGGSALTGGTNASGAAGSNAIGGTAGPSDGGEPNGDAGEGMGGTGTAGTGGNGGAGGTSTAGTGGVGGTAAGGGGTSGNAGTSGSGGNGGSGGSVAVAMCSDHVIPAKSKWMATASEYSLGTGMEDDGLYNPPSHMIDSNYTERWSSGKTQVGGEWIQIDFGATVNLTDVVLNVRGNAGDYPRMYEVRLSTKTNDLTGKVLAMGNGMPTAADPDNTNITLSAMSTGRYLTVKQTGVNTVDAAWWTVSEVLVSCTDP
jgi:hypothetical protein